MGRENICFRRKLNREVLKMKNNILSKDEFVAIMNEWDEVKQYHDALNMVVNKYCDNAYLDQPDCSIGLLHTLSKMFTTNNDSDVCVLIEFFVGELDFGRDYVKGLVTDENGNEIMLRNAEDLYDLLVKNLEISEQYNQ